MEVSRDLALTPEIRSLYHSTIKEFDVEHSPTTAFKFGRVVVLRSDTVMMMAYPYNGGVVLHLLHPEPAGEAELSIDQAVIGFFEITQLFDCSTEFTGDLHFLVPCLGAGQLSHRFSWQ